MEAFELCLPQLQTFQMYIFNELAFALRAVSYQQQNQKNVVVWATLGFWTRILNPVK